MEDTFLIGEISKLLDIPTATLRFWEEKGLFHVEKSENRYRRYSVRSLVEIADVVFLRNLGIPVSRVSAMGSCALDEYASQLQSIQGQLEQKLRVYERTYRKTQAQLQHIREVRTLMEEGFAIEEIPFEAVYPFDFQERDKLLRYVEDPAGYVRYFDTRNMLSEQRGIILPPKESVGKPLWQKKQGATFLTFLIREKAEQDYASDVLQSLSRIRPFYNTGELLARYLLSAEEDGERIDYLKAYLEVWPWED